MPRGPALSEEWFDALRQMWLLGVDAIVIAQMLGVDRPSVHKARARLGLQPRGGKYSKRDVDPTLKEIAERSQECRARRAPENQKPAHVEIKAYVYDRAGCFTPFA